MPDTTSNTDQAKGRRTPPDPPRLNVVSAILFLTIFGLGLAATIRSGHPAGVLLGGPVTRSNAVRQKSLCKAQNSGCVNLQHRGATKWLTRAPE